MEEKINLIKENKDVFIHCLNKILDKIYNLTDTYFDEDGKLKEGLTPDEKLENFIRGLREDSEKYEKIRSKLIADDFNLSLLEISLVGLSGFFVIQTFTNNIKNITKAKDELEKIVQKLIPAENKSEQVDKQD